METFLCSGPCGQRLPRSAFHEWSPRRRRPVMPVCKACRSLAYRKRRYPEACRSCGLHTRLASNQCCRECNARQGLRECRHCHELLPAELCFYARKARCKDCLKASTPR